jgi:hypothetical protein
MQQSPYFIDLHLGIIEQLLQLFGFHGPLFVDAVGTFAAINSAINT